MFKDKFVTDSLENMAEEIVFEELHQLMTHGDIEFCQCDICLQDIAAITLNKVPSKYISSYLEKTNPQQQFVETLDGIRKAAQDYLPKAIASVKDNVHH